ncbi:metal ABC transporter solute-binding protein, Zn/Mn family [Lusitaniella coriacea]|uniref:metal ABC transporter solute-binding protein, Zn/Mn family n=1 Tax=Lusitaniella coriacea TaxID=1983105 RepID=UPI002D21C2CF|nr:zinc ABC transporter substrate-binding protein [Lusitaniella coriacea]
MTTQEKPQVVASSSILCDLTQQIAQDTVELNCLMAPEQDPHTYVTTPSNRKAMETATLIFYGGYQLAPSIENLVKAINTSAPKVAVYEEAVPEPLQSEHHHHEEEEHHHEEEEHHHEEEENHHEEELEPDPHVWHNVQNGIAIVGVIEEKLAEINPEQAQRYAQNAEQLKGQLEELDAWVKQQVATIPEGQRTLVTTHDAFNYYSQAYGFESSEALQGMSTEEKPTATRVKELVEKVEETKVPTIFAEVTANNQVIGTVAREAKVKVSERELFTGALGSKEDEAGTYRGAIAANTCTIVNGLGGECTPFNR